MDLVTESTYDDSVFEHDSKSPDTAKQTTEDNVKRKADETIRDFIGKNDTKDIQETKDFYDDGDTTLPVLDTTTDTANLPNQRESKPSNIADTTEENKTVDKENDSETVTQKVNNDMDKDTSRYKQDGKLTEEESRDKHGDSPRKSETQINIAETLADYEKPVDKPEEKTPRSPRKTGEAEGQGQGEGKSALKLSRQESDVTSIRSLRTSEFESRQFLNSERFYFQTGFPSLISYLGPNATNKTSKEKKKNETKLPKQTKRVKQQEEENSRLSKTHHQKQYAAFSIAMKRRNESTWNRIEAVAKEKMELYERYAVDMTLKIKRQREQINRRSQELLESLARIEEKKREDKIYDSPHGRMWRHHRSMQRRVFNLEPMSNRDKGYLSMNSGRSELTEN